MSDLRTELEKLAADYNREAAETTPTDTFDADAFESFVFLASDPDWDAEDSDGLDSFEALARA